MDLEAENRSLRLENAALKEELARLKGMPLAGEEWRPVRGAEFYEVSDQGRVRTIARRAIEAGRERFRRSILLRQKMNRGGYAAITLYSQGKALHTTVHRLVAEAFLPNEDKLPCINHINGNRKDNRATNLEWVTWSENSIHAMTNGKMRPRANLPKPKLTVFEVKKMRRLREIGMRYSDISEVMRLNKSTVYDAITGRTWGDLL